MRRFNLNFVFWLGALCGVLSLPFRAAAEGFELSGGFNFNQSSYTGDNYSWSRRFGATFGYYVSAMSQIEISFQDITDRTKITGYEDTTFHDQITSVNWVQTLASRKSPVQPYVKAGVGQLNREATGNYASGGSPPLLYDSVTGVLGGGVRLYLTKTLGVRAEGTTYLTGGSIGTYKDNFGFTFGVSVGL